MKGKNLSKPNFYTIVEKGILWVELRTNPGKIVSDQEVEARTKLEEFVLKREGSEGNTFSKQL